MLNFWHRIRPLSRPNVDLERAVSPEPPPTLLSPRAHATLDTWAERTPDIAQICVASCAQTLSAIMQAVAQPQRRHPPRLDPERGPELQDV